MKRKTYLILVLALFLAACGNSQTNTEKQTKKMAQEAVDGDKATDLTGIFSSEGKSYSGKVSTQIFPATKEYSVLCQADDEKGTLMQATFKDETSARTEQTLKIVKGSIMHASEPNEVKIDFDLKYQSKDDKAGFAKVVKEGGKYYIVVSDAELSDADEKEKKTVSGKIPF